MIHDEYADYQFLQAMSIDGQDTLFGQDNVVAQATSQPQLPEPENKMDDSIDNQQQVIKGQSDNSTSKFEMYLILYGWYPTHIDHILPLCHEGF